MDTHVKSKSQFELIEFASITNYTGYMRLDSNGQCKDVAKIPVVVLTEKGVVPFRRNGPVVVSPIYRDFDTV